jgi:hypothetical protein
MLLHMRWCLICTACMCCLVSLQPLPDALRGEKWAFVQLPLGNLREMLGPVNEVRPRNSRFQQNFSNQYSQDTHACSRQGRMLQCAACPRAAVLGCLSSRGSLPAAAVQRALWTSIW